MSSAPVQAHRASVNGLDTYYEVQGSGTPLVMLHGAILVDLGPSVAALARDHTVITPAAPSSRLPDRPSPKRCCPDHGGRTGGTSRG